MDTIPSELVPEVYGHLWLGSILTFSVDKYTFRTCRTVDRVIMSTGDTHLILGTLSETIRRLESRLETPPITRIMYLDMRSLTACVSVEVGPVSASYSLPHRSTSLTTKPGAILFHGGQFRQSIGIRQIHDSLYELWHGLGASSSMWTITPWALERLLIDYSRLLVRDGLPSYTEMDVYVAMCSVAVKL